MVLEMHLSLTQCSCVRDASMRSEYLRSDHEGLHRFHPTEVLRDISNYALVC